MTNEQSERESEQVKHIAEELERVAEGEVYKNEDGEICYEDDVEGDEIPDDWEQVGMIDWLEDGIYDVRYILDSNREYLGVELMIACGGPNIWVSTLTSSVELYWWGDRASYSLSGSAVDELDEVGRALYGEW